MSERATIVVPTANPILAPSLKPPEAGADVGVDVDVIEEPVICAVLPAEAPGLLGVVVAAAKCDCDSVTVDAAADEDFDVEADMLTVVKGAPSCRVLIFGSS